jgi:pimeloyl-ACP methyl ester carboxylesterase
LYGVGWIEQNILYFPNLLSTPRKNWRRFDNILHSLTWFCPDGKEDNMPTTNVNGVEIFYRLSGTGEIPLVFVHGGFSWHNTWNLVVPDLAVSFRVLVYDRRGHGQSQRTPGQGIQENVDDLAALIERLELAPAWVIGNSYGVNIALRLAGEHPELLRGLIGHEPRLDALIVDDPAVAPMLEKLNRGVEAVLERIESGDHAGGVEQFMEMAIGPGSWVQFSNDRQQTYIGNAPTFLDEARDRQAFAFDPAWIEAFPRPVLLTMGGQSAPFVAPMYTKVTDLVPKVEVKTFPGAGHMPHVTHPDAYVEATTTFIQKHQA